MLMRVSLRLFVVIGELEMVPEYLTRGVSSPVAGGTAARLAPCCMDRRQIGSEYQFANGKIPIVRERSLPDGEDRARGLRERSE